MAVLAAVATTAVGCIVPAPVDPVGELAQPILVIRKNDTIPHLDGKRFAFTAATPEFQADSAVSHTATGSPLYYYWYYDVTTDGVLNQVCSTPNCKLAPCTYTSSSGQNPHTLLLVVADHPRPLSQSLSVEDSKNPLKFAPGTVYDAGQWTFDLTVGLCK